MGHQQQVNTKTPAKAGVFYSIPEKNDRTIYTCKASCLCLSV
ncbi:hypothetical protein CRENPOLYSF2_1000004 [Crenothrix polyspora]|uniref:Uncharacterized protein n=1 Tax=Crenothrix polyspora TaxID=360316 RepID=A0A1R4GYQ1_9GAMM|nr:hypothetical protein CRENPOLYSF2_1000004 [Crenothrix polyspora]